MGDDPQGELAKMFNKGFFERFHSGKRKEMGYVKDVTEESGRTFVSWVNEHGEPGTFVYDQGDKRFSGAQNGFATGDVIQTEMSGSRILSARPLQLNDNEKQEITSKFRRIGEE